MALTATEQSILKVVAELTQASTSQINGQTGLSLGYVEYLCAYLARCGCLMPRGQRRYGIAPKGKRLLVSLGYDFGLDKELVKQLAREVGKEVAREIRIQNIRPPGKEPSNGVQIRTDYDLGVEDESVGLETNIKELGAKVEKEKGDSLDASIRRLKNISARGAPGGKKKVTGDEK